MIRPIFTELALFLTPFVVYAVFLVATRAGVLHPAAWSPAGSRWLMIAALVLMIGSFRRAGASSAARRRTRPMCRRMSRTASCVPGQTK